MTVYNPTSWYWIVAGEAGQVFSSASGTLVPTTNATYQAWLAAGNMPSRAGGITWSELADVLMNQAPAAWLRAAAALQASGGLTSAQSATLALATGLTVASTGTPAVNGTYACDAATQQQMMAEILAINTNGTFADGTTSIEWRNWAMTATATFTVALFKELVTAVGAFVSGNTKVINGLSTTLPPASVTIA